MSGAIRFEILGDVCPETVIGEQFHIDGSDEVFAVHTATSYEKEELGFFWSATHVATGLRISKGQDIQEAIDEARKVWISKTPEELAAAIKRGHAERERAFSLQALLTSGVIGHD